MSLINIINLTFSYDGSYDNVFENVSFRLDTDWKLGFTGRNGRGKTTFLNLLRGKYEYSGSITGSVDFEYFPYEVREADMLRNTIDIIEGISVSHEYWELVRELSLLSVGEEVLFRPFGTLSNGERTKTLLAALFLKENAFLLIDEPTNHLDMAAREIVSGYLNGKKGFILVSHDRAFLDNCTDHILSINKTDIEVRRGNFSAWLMNKERQDNFEINENERLKRDIKRLEKSFKEKAAWSDKAESRKIGFDPRKTEKSEGRRPYEGMKSKKMMKLSKNIEARRSSEIEEKKELLKNVEESAELKLFQPAYHKTDYLELENISLFYGDKEICKNISFKIKEGSRTALCGGNGSGKSSLFKLILGEEISYKGVIRKGSGLIISHVPQDTSFLSGSLSDFVRGYGLDESLFKAVLRKLEFSRTQFEKDMAAFSQGQKKKVLIAKSLCEKAHLLLWDEPLNYIDVISRMQIEELILKYKPTILFIEHDAAFCESTATERIDL